MHIHAKSTTGKKESRRKYGMEKMWNVRIFSRQMKHEQGAARRQSFLCGKGVSSGMKRFSELIEKSSTGDGAGTHGNHSGVQKGRFKIMKSEDDRMLAFGWASVSMRVNGELIEDWQEDIVEPEELENAAYRFVELYREGGEMHERGGAAVLIESIVFTEEKMQAMGIPAGILPVGWWIGFKVLDKDVWEKVKDGTYSMLSIEGEAERIKINECE